MLERGQSLSDIFRVCSAVTGVLNQRGGSLESTKPCEATVNCELWSLLRSQVSTCAASGAASQTFGRTLTRMLAASHIKWKWQILNPVPVRCFNPAPGSTPGTSVAREREDETSGAAS